MACLIAWSEERERLARDAMQVMQAAAAVAGVVKGKTRIFQSETGKRAIVRDVGCGTRQSACFVLDFCSFFNDCPLPFPFERLSVELTCHRTQAQARTHLSYPFPSSRERGNLAGNCTCTLVLLKALEQRSHTHTNAPEKGRQTRHKTQSSWARNSKDDGSGTAIKVTRKTVGLSRILT